MVVWFFVCVALTFYSLGLIHYRLWDTVGDRFDQIGLSIVITLLAGIWGMAVFGLGVGLTKLLINVIHYFRVATNY